MGVSVHYWAMPTESRLYRRVLGEPAFHVFLLSFFPQGNGIYRYLETEATPEEVDEILEWIMGHWPDVVGPEMQGRERFEEFQEELTSTRTDYPGIEDRTAMLEKCDQEIHARLVPKFELLRASGRELLDKIMYGEETLVHASLKGDTLGLVSPKVVREGAEILRKIQPKNLFPLDDEHWQRQNYQYWRRVYLDAAKHGEAMFIGVS